MDNDLLILPFITLERITDYITGFIFFDGVHNITNSHQVHVKNGKLHREDGPAYITEDLELWAINNMLHRIGGPAFITDVGADWYFIENKWLHETEYICAEREYKLGQFLNGISTGNNQNN